MRTGDNKMSAAKTVVNERCRDADRMNGKLAFHFYPAGFRKPSDHQLGVRFMSALAAAALLLPDAQTDQLTSFVSHLLETDQEIIPSAVAPELEQLKESDFNWFVSHQLALVLERGGTVEEMSEHWFSDLDPQPFQGLLIEGELDIEQMRRLNDIPLIKVNSTCAGEPGTDVAHPYFRFVVRRSVARRRDMAIEVAAHMRGEDTEAFASGKSVQVQSRLANDGTNRGLLHEWWQRNIDRLAKKMRTYESLDRLVTMMQRVGGIAGLTHVEQPANGRDEAVDVVETTA